MQARRSEREREQYNQGLQRDGYNRVLSHTSLHSLKRRDDLIRDQMKFIEGKEVLELGSSCWIQWVEGFGLQPKRLTCINISERELEKGVNASSSTRVKPEFKLMDANHLQFPTESFDFVFGGAILHHLDFEQAVRETARVLKPGGRILFVEPLGINPVSKLVRFLTPKARTVDEQPLRFRELSILRDYFNLELVFEQLSSVPAGIVSLALFKNADNAVTRSAFRMDRWVEDHLPVLRPLFRNVLVFGSKAREQ